MYISTELLSIKVSRDKFRFFMHYLLHYLLHSRGRLSPQKMIETDQNISEIRRAKLVMAFCTAFICVYVYIQGVPKTPATPHKMVYICRYMLYMCYIINWLILQHRQFNFTQLWKVSSSKLQWLLQNASLSNINQNSLCTGFG